MNNFQTAAQVRRATRNMAYNLLSKCDEPDRAYDGDGYYTVEHWQIDPIDLHEAVSVHLGNKGIETRPSQVSFFVQHFLEGDEYQEMIEQFREDYYMHRELEQDPHAFFGVSQSDFIAIN